MMSPVLVSLAVSTLATMLCVIFGVPLGFFLATHSFRAKRICLTFLNTLLALPTVVIGLLVYMLLSRQSPLGSFGLLYRIPAIIIGQFILALPLMIAFTHSAVAAVELRAKETAITLGAESFALTRTLLVESRFGIIAAIAACFGRLIGEVGISMILGGNIEGYTRTMTTAVTMEVSKGNFSYALHLGGILILIALFVNIVLQYAQGKHSR